LQSQGLLTDGFHEKPDEGGEIRDAYPTASLTKNGIKQYYYNRILRSPVRRFIYRLCHKF